MADPLREKILENVKAALQTITVANGFNQDLKTVERDRLSPLEINLFPAAIVIDLGETVERLGTQVDRVDLTVMVEAWVRAETGHSTEVNRLVGDIRKKLGEDVTRGGNAQDTRWEGSESVLALAEQPLRGEQIKFVIRYRSKLNDPFATT